MTDASAAPPIVDDDEETFVDWRPTGGISIVVDGKRTRLRSPRMRDYRHLYELWREEAEALEAASEELTQFLSDVMGRGDDRERAGQPRITADEHQRDRELGRKIRVATEDAALRWWREAIARLVVGGTTDLELDDLPVFMATSDSVNHALNHWRSVPSRSGAR